DVAPDALVLQELRDEPAEAERRPRGERGFGGRGLRGRASREDHPGREARVEFVERCAVRLLAPGLAVEELLARRLYRERGRERVTRLEEGDAGQSQSGQLATADRSLAHSELERLGRGEHRGAVVRRRKLLEQYCGIERHPVQLAQAAQYPNEFLVR